jgi:hypothetical protein
MQFLDELGLAKSTPESEGNESKSLPPGSVNISGRSVPSMMAYLREKYPEYMSGDVAEEKKPAKKEKTPTTPEDLADIEKELAAETARSAPRKPGEQSSWPLFGPTQK